jgi:photosystem II stability/assembly factor-like uncharacterized protein
MNNWYSYWKLIILVILSVQVTCGFHQASLAQDKAVLDENTFGEIKARQIGPATMSGRISAIDALDSDPRIVYVGAASGGVWKSKNAGTTFKAVFDDYAQSIGAIAIDQNHPDTVWVGTGECWTRNSVSVGDGIYKTTDGGEKWTYMGLKETERIAKIIINPRNPDIIYVAAMGHLWNANPERGVYKTSDGGKTWEKILFVDENTGCSDLAIDFEKPDILYAAMWDYRRQPYYFRSGGIGSGFYRSTDGGNIWQKITANFPEGMLGRIAVAVSPAAPRIVYAAIEAKKSGLYRSRDRGESWELMSTNQVVGERPFYFALLVTDTKDTNRIYKPGFTLNVSDDGGKTYTVPFVGGGNIHSDLHALYVSKKDNHFLYLGTDGGLFLSMDKGNTWKMIRNLPVSQFYHVTTDDARPYNVYGGLQDNGSWYGPTKSPNGINNRDWENVGFGDGFNVLCDRSDPNILFWQYQAGNIRRYYKDTREFKDIRPFAEKGLKELRFNWNTPLISGASSGALYVGSQYLFRSDNRGDTWERISPDLSTDDPKKEKQEETGGLTIDNSSAENHCTIYTIAESPLDKNIVWAGTDDGNLQLTTNGGASWANLIQNIPGLPQATWCSSVCPDRFDKGTAFVTFDGHRTGDMKPYVFKTSDYGKTWSSLADTSLKIYCHVIRQDPVNKNLLFLGTEFGLYLSIDAGRSWCRFKGNIPKVPVMDMVININTNDLILATHGRGIMIIDDLTPIRQLTPELLNADLAFLDTRPFEIGFLGSEQRMEGDDEFSGDNPPNNITITYYMKKRHVFGDMSMEILNQNDSLIKTIPAGKRKGINRVAWEMQMDPPKVPSSVQLLGQAMTGPSYPPGIYKIKILKGDKTYEGNVNVIWDPNSKHSAADRDLRHKTIMGAYSMLENLAFIDRQIRDIRDKSLEKAKLSKKKSAVKELNVLADTMETWHKNITATREGQVSGEERLRERLGEIYGGLMNYQGKPTDSQIERLGYLGKEVGDYADRVKNIIRVKLEEINKELEKEGLGEITVIIRDEFMKEK